jgi:hypothetical protein
VGQAYETRVADVFVMMQNDAFVACSLPAYASELLAVESWATNEGDNIEKTQNYGNRSVIIFFV